jgi:hypothetical protein
MCSVSIHGVCADRLPFMIQCIWSLVAHPHYFSTYSSILFINNIPCNTCSLSAALFLLHGSLRHSLSPCAVCVLVCCVCVSVGACVVHRWALSLMIHTLCSFTLMYIQCIILCSCVACMGVSVCVCCVCVCVCVVCRCLCHVRVCTVYEVYGAYQATCVIQPCTPTHIHTYTHTYAFIPMYSHMYARCLPVYASVSVCAWCVCRNRVRLCATCVPTGHTYTHFHTHTHYQSLYTLSVVFHLYYAHLLLCHLYYSVTPVLATALPVLCDSFC